MAEEVLKKMQLLCSGSLKDTEQAGVDTIRQQYDNALPLLCRCVDLLTVHFNSITVIIQYYTIRHAHCSIQYKIYAHKQQL